MRLFNIKSISPVNFIICGQLISEDSFIHMKRKFNENVLILVQEGSLFINSNNRNFTVSENEFLILRKNEEHFGVKESPGKLKYYWVHFSDDIDIISEQQNINNYTFPEYGKIQNPTRLLILFKQLMDYSLEKNLFIKDILNYSLSLFLMELSQNYFLSINKKSENTNPIVNDIYNWIKLNFHRDFSLDELSKELKLQSNYISKIFKQNTGQTILQFTTDLRITTSKIFLQNFSVKETAFSCGFRDEKYFMKVFKKNEGITPTQFKQAFSLKTINHK